MNLPNKISIFRIAATPVFLFFLLPGWFGQFFGLSEWGRWAAVVVFIIASASDAVDGYIARKYHLITDLGKFLDPIADKLLVTSALIALIQTDGLSAWGVFIILAREFIVTGIRVVAAGQGKVIAASPLGKWKTIVQLISIITLLLHNYPFAFFNSFPIGETAFWLAVMLTVVSGIDYLVKNRHVLSAEKAAK